MIRRILVIASVVMFSVCGVFAAEKVIGKKEEKQKEKPLIYIPFDDGMDVFISGKVKPQFEGTVEDGEYVAGKKGKGLMSIKTKEKTTIAYFKELNQMVSEKGTLMFWYKPEWNKSNSEEYWIFNYFGCGWHYGFFMVKPVNQETLNVVFRSPYPIPPQTEPFSDRNMWVKLPFKKSEWNHVAYTWDMDTDKVCLYVDGDFVSEATHTHKNGDLKLPDNVAENKLGDLMIGNKDKKIAIGGVIDEIKFYNRTFTEDEITKAYNEENEE